MRKPLLPLVLLAVCTSAAPASCQRAAPPASGAATQPPHPRPPLYTGIEFNVSVERGADGTMRPSYPTVRNVVPGSPADSAGVAVGDVIVEINGRDTRLEGASGLRPAAPNTYRLRRGDEELEVVITTTHPPAVRQPGS